METHSLEVSRVIAAPRAAVFAAFLDAHADIMRNFVPTGPDGNRMQMIIHEMTPEVGGTMAYSMAPAGASAEEAGSHRIVGSYVEIKPDEKIVRTEVPPMPDGSTGPETHVSFLFEDVDGGTQVTIRHEGLPDPGWAAGAKMGWASALENLATAYAEIA